VFEQYRAFMAQYIKLNALEWAVFKSKVKVSHHKKGEIIHYAGDVMSNLMFMNSGIVRAYTISDEGKDITWHIYFSDENAQMVNLYAVDYDSFVNRTPSELSFEVLEDCEIFSTSYDDVQFLYHYRPKGNEFGRKMAELAYTQVHRMYLRALKDDAITRFEKFMQETPYLLDKVPQYHIASMLGIAPQSLSRLKAQLKERGLEESID
jgi:CRP-like cAMP-binding protein